MMAGLPRSGRGLALGLLLIVLGAAPVLAQSAESAPATSQSSESAAPGATQAEGAPGQAASESDPAATSQAETAGQAQDSHLAEGVPSIPREKVEDLLSTLKDEQARNRLIEQLETLVALETPETDEPTALESAGAKLLRVVTDRIGSIGEELDEAFVDLENAPALVDDLLAEFKDEHRQQVWLEALVRIGIVLGLAIAAELLVAFLLRGLRRRLEDKRREALAVRVGYLALRTLLRAFELAAFAAAAYATLTLVDPRFATRLAALTIINANILVRLGLLAATVILTPEAPTLRLLPVSDESAGYLFRWIRRFLRVGVFGFLALEAGLVLGLTWGLYDFLGQLLALVLAILGVVFVLQNRRAVAQRLKTFREAEGNPLAWFVGRFAEVWHLVALAFVVAVYLTWALDIPGGFAFLAKAAGLTVVIVVAAALARRTLGTAIDRAFAPDPTRGGLTSLPSKAYRYKVPIKTALSVLIVIAEVVALLEVWGFGILELFSSDSGREALARIASILGIIVGGVLVWELSGVVTTRIVENAERSGSTPGRVQRLRTLLPLLRTSVRVFLSVLLVLVVLSEIGINIAPLLAGAGVVGLAIGFGAQALVKDVITGVFILLEDVIAVGDIIDLGGHSGVVESMTIRTVRLRDVEGSLHTLPFGDIATVTNFGRGFSQALLDVGIAYREDVDEALAVMKEVGDALAQDPEHKASVLAPIEMFGVQELGDSAVVLRARMKVKPLTQWGIKRAYLRAIKKAFDERGIEIPFPHQTIYFGELKTAGDTPPARVLTLEEQVPTAAPAPEEGPEPPTEEKAVDEELDKTSKTPMPEGDDR